MSVEQFNNFSGGLNLRDKSDVVENNEAIDLLNVTFTDRGAIKQRDGYVDLTGDLTNRVDSLGLFSTTSGTRHILAGCGTRLEALSTAGAVVASKTGLANGPYTFARFAAPTTELTYAGNGTDTIQKWDGSNWTSGAATATVNGTGSSAMPKAASICITSNTNRLVATGYGTGTTSGPAGTTSNPSRVHFSNIGAPETWETDGNSGRGANYVDLTPGDGEEVMAAVTWRDLVFVFKQSKFFVFYGESSQSNGTPIFNYRSVQGGVGLAAKQAITVAREGVYFMSSSGVYLTTGTDPVLISDKIRPIWDQNPEVYFQSDPINMAHIDACRMGWHNEQVYVAYPSGTGTTNDRTLVYDTQHKWWSVWNIPASALISYQRGDSPELHFGYASGNKRVGRIGVGITNDLAGTTITSRWRSGWGDYKTSLTKVIRENRLWGTGATTVEFSTDFNLLPSTTNSAVFSVAGTWPSSGTWSAWSASNGGTWPGGDQVTDVLARRAVKGKVFSTTISNNAASASWSLHRIAKHIQEGNRPFSA